MSQSQFPADAKILAHEIKPVLDAIEKGRIHSLGRIRCGWSKITIAAIVTVAICVLTLVASSARSSQNNMTIVAIPLALIGIGYCVFIYSKFISGHKALYRAVYKEKVIAGMTRLIQPDMLYSQERGISEQTFKEMGLYSDDVDRYHCEDLFAGKIGKTAIMFSEAHAEDKRTRTDSKGRSSTYWVTIFKGLLTIVDFNKDFRSWVIVKPDFAESAFGWFGRKIQAFSSNLVRLENPQFEKAFVVHSGDQVAARYILTPDMQDRLLDLRKWFGNDIRIAFHSSRMHLTIPNSDNWFEPDITRSAQDTSQMHTFIHQMTSIFRLVEILDLNTRIWTKE